MDIQLAAVIAPLVCMAFLMAYIVFSELRNYRERGKLVDRLMSRDFSDYYEKQLQERHIVEQAKKPPKPPQEFTRL